MNKNFFLSYVSFLILTVSCDQLGDACTEEKYGSALVSEFPDSLEAGVAQDIYIKYILENSCGSFKEFEETVAENIVEIKFKARYEGCNCELQFEEDSSVYALKQDSAGTYTYKFFLGDTDYDTYNLVVF
jgi:hypothetical protein